MKKIIRLTESDLMNLVKRVIKEQEGVSSKHSTFLNLVTKLKPYGFIEDKRMEQMLGKGFLILSKGDDNDGIQIMFNINNLTWSWSVVQSGVSKVNKERKIEGDYSIIDKIEGIIMNDIKPYISMKVKPTSNNVQESNQRLEKRILNEGLSQTNFKVGQKFKEVHNRQFIMSKSYLTAGSGGGAHNYNDFAFNNPIVVKVSNVGVTLKIDSGMYNPNDEWKNGQKFEEVDDFCLDIPYNKMQEISDNQLMLSIPNSSFKTYIVPCSSGRPGRVLN